MKLIVDEPESAALASALVGSGPHVTSVVGEIETRRACARATPQPPASRVEAVLTPVSTIALDDAVGVRAAALEPRSLRSLDAIHLATALEVGDLLEALVTYDGRLADAAEAVGVTVLLPR